MNITLDSVVLSAAISAIVAVIIAVINNQYNKNRVKTEADFTFSQTIKQYIEGGGDIAEMALKIANEYEKQVNALNIKIEELREIISLQNDYIKTMADAMRGSGMDVPARPEKLRDTDPKLRAVK